VARLHEEQAVVVNRAVRHRDAPATGREKDQSQPAGIGPALGKPGASSSTLALRTVPVSAGIVGDLPLSAILTGLDMSAQGGSAAVLDRGHHLELGQAEMPFLLCAVGWAG
jgi:hypothetical protein